MARRSGGKRQNVWLSSSARPRRASAACRSMTNAFQLERMVWDALEAATTELQAVGCHASPSAPSPYSFSALAHLSPPQSAIQHGWLCCCMRVLSVTLFVSRFLCRPRGHPATCSPSCKPALRSQLRLLYSRAILPAEALLRHFSRRLRLKHDVLRTDFSTRPLPPTASSPFSPHPSLLGGLSPLPPPPFPPPGLPRPRLAGPRAGDFPHARQCGALSDPRPACEPAQMGPLSGPPPEFHIEL